MILVVTEGKDDKLVMEALLRKLSLHSHFIVGTPELGDAWLVAPDKTDGAVEWLEAEIARLRKETGSEIESVLLIFDLDLHHWSKEERERQKRRLRCALRTRMAIPIYVFLVHSTIESWLFSDEKAVSTVIKRSYRCPNPDKQGNYPKPKSFVQRRVWHGYKGRVHNAELAEACDPRTIRKRSRNFAAFCNLVRRLVRACR
ncbi:MAG: hypothetical protein DRP63_09005 [Planctomycetota bacterium]|nr:MAG: hypothetical protein DRP63_09005 [Planctomycetota bacterium]